MLPDARRLIMLGEAGEMKGLTLDGWSTLILIGVVLMALVWAGNHFGAYGLRDMLTDEQTVLFTAGAGLVTWGALLKWKK